MSNNNNSKQKARFISHKDRASGSTLSHLGNVLGRPSVKDRNMPISFKISQKEKELLISKSNAAGMSMVDYFCKLLVEG